MSNAVGRLLYCLTLGLLMPATAAEPAVSDPQVHKHVLILNSYHAGFPWTDDLVRTLSRDLRKSFRDIEVMVEYMDAKRFSEQGQDRLFLEMLPAKYADHPVDLIVATDDVSLRFLHEHARDIFPRTPVVFCGASDEVLMQRLDRSRFTGVHELFRGGRLIDMVRRLRPAARQVYIVVDAADGNQIFIDMFRRELAPGSRIQPVFLLARELGLGGILERLRGVPDDSVVVALSFTQDRNGVVVRVEDSMARIAAASPVPVVSPNISALGQGILAGNVNGGIRHGEFTARIVTRVLNGESPQSIPIQPEGGFGPVFDYAAMQRWGVGESQLPEEAVILNRPKTLWDEYRQWVLLACGLIGAQMAIIALLVWSITARRKAERELLQSELRHRAMVENAIDGIYSHDLDGRMTAVNQTMLKMLGYERHELLGMSTSALVAPEHRQKVLDSTARKRRGESSPPYEIVVITRDRRRLWVEVSSRVLLRDGQPFGVEGVLRDISQRKNLENQLLQAQKMDALGRLAGGIAHDFNNILTVICGYANLLVGESWSPKQRERLEQIRRAGDQAAQLTRHLLTFSRSQAAEPAPVNLNHVVKDMLKMLRRFIGEDVQLVTRLDPSLASVLADSSQLGQVVMNLALNARDAMPNGGTLTIETANDGVPSRVVLSVTDTGIGMDAETLRRVFDPFFTTKEAGRGTGLGLSLVYGIVRQYEGEITADSEPGKGTSFRVSFPATQGAPAGADVAGARSVSSGNETVLVVEDRPEVREFAVNVLAQGGYRVLSAVNGVEALDMAANADGHLDLLLTDVVMPGMTGSELAEKLVTRRPGLKVVLMSGYTAGAALDGRYGAPLAKPFTPEDLLRRIRSELDAVRLRS